MSMSPDFHARIAMLPLRVQSFPNYHIKTDETTTERSTYFKKIRKNIFFQEGTSIKIGNFWTLPKHVDH